MKRVLIVSIILFSSKILSQNVFLGPMLHYNFGSKQSHFSWGIEVSYWPNDIIMGADFGVDFEKGKTRLYLEYEVGAIFGLAFGYMREFYNDKSSKGGFQGSFWGAVYGGVDLRFRKIEDDYYTSPGIFAKYFLTK